MASGLVFLAFATQETADRILALKRGKITPKSITSNADIQRMAEQFRTQGYVQTRNSFEDDAASTAMSFFLVDPRIQQDPSPLLYQGLK